MGVFRPRSRYAPPYMETPPDKIAEDMKQKAKVCQTIAEDKTQESLTGEPAEKVMNEAEAKAWQEKSRLWAEAEAMVRTHAKDSAPPAK